MSALYPDVKRFESSPFKRLGQTPRLHPHAAPASPSRSPQSRSKHNQPSASKSTLHSQFTPSSSRSPFTKRTATCNDFSQSRGLAGSKQFMSSESLSSNLSTNTDSTVIRRSNTTRSSRDTRDTSHTRSPVKLRATANRLARQTSEILTTLDGPTKRPFPRSPPKLNKENFEPEPLKRRKVVSFDDKLDESQELRQTVLVLQERVVKMQQEHNEQMADLRKMVSEQSRLISELISRR